MNRTNTVTAFLLWLLCLASATSFAQVGVSRSGCISSTLPGPDEALIYRHANYGGDCRILSVGNYPNSAYFGLPNDSVSSVKVGENVRIDLFIDSWFSKYDLDWIFILEGPGPEDPDYNPFVSIHWRGQPYLSRFYSPSGTWNDVTSSIRVQQKDHLEHRSRIFH